jgi:hypothetical protein
MRPKTLIVSLMALALASCAPDPGAGTLEAIIEPEGETAGFGDFTTGRDKTFGIFVCSNDGPVELQSIEAVLTDGNIEFLGAMVYTSADRFVGATHGYPPDGLDGARIEPLEGAVIDSDCEDPTGDQRVQLLVGAERTASGGGVIDGLVLDTSGGDLDIPFTVLLCGDELQYCEVLVPEEEG